MAIKLADTARPNNYVDDEHLGTFPVAYAEDIWFDDGTRLSDKTFDGQSIQVTELPLASATEEGHVYQYIGTTGTYVHGCFYECVEQSGNYDWKILQTVENCVFYTDRNIVDSTSYPVGTVVVYTGEPQWGFFKGHHYMYDENKTLTLYKFNCNYNGARVSVVFSDKELKVGTTRLRDFDGYIVDYISEINGDTVTVTNRGGSTETLTDLVYAEETEDITFTGWFDIGGGGSGDGGTDYEEFIGTQAEWDALSSTEKAKYDGKIVNITDDSEGENLDYYSTSEVKTNKVWIDGKPIYRKVIPVTITTRYTTMTYEVIDSSLTKNNCTLIDYGGCLKTGTSSDIYDKPIPRVYTTGDTSSSLNVGACMEVVVSSEGLRFGSVNVTVGNTGYVWVEYTKTAN